MAAKFKRPLLEVVNVGAARTATIKMPLGKRYQKVVLHATNAALVANTMITQVRIKIGSKTQRIFTMDELQALYLLMGQNGSTQYGIQNNTAGSQVDIPIWFAEPWRTSLQDQRAFGWATGRIPSMTIEIDIAAAATALTLTATARYDTPVVTQANIADYRNIYPDIQIGEPLPCGIINKWYEQNIDITSTTKTFSGLEQVDVLHQISINDAYVTKLEFILGDETIREVNVQELNSDLTGDGMTSSSSWTHLVFDDDDDPLSGIPLNDRKNVYLKLTFSDGTPRSVPIVVQRAGLRD